MKTFMPELPPEQRLRLLQENCDSHEQASYYKELTQDELDSKRESLSENLITASALEDDLADIKKEFKLKLDPLKDERKSLLTEIKTRKQEITGTLFSMANYEEAMMETYDESGELVSSRRLRPEEKQLKAFPLKKAE